MQVQMRRRRTPPTRKESPNSDIKCHETYETRTTLRVASCVLRSSSVTNSWTYVLLLTKWKNNNTPNNTGFRDIDQATHYTNSKKDTAALSFISFRQQICGCLKKLIDFRSNSNIFLWHVFGRVVYHMYD